MKKALLNLLIVLAAAALAFNIGLRASGPLRVQCVGPKATVATADSGALDSDGSCDLSWAYCWVRT